MNGLLLELITKGYALYCECWTFLHRLFVRHLCFLAAINRVIQIQIQHMHVDFIHSLAFNEHRASLPI